MQPAIIAISAKNELKEGLCAGLQGSSISFGGIRGPSMYPRNLCSRGTPGRVGQVLKRTLDLDLSTK